MNRFSNINALVAFVTVAREGSVSRAAEVLNLTQPAISHQIKRLSEETGIKLFTRTPVGLQITVDGAALIPKAQQVLGAMSEFRRIAGKRSGHISGKLRIGTIIDPEFIRLGQLLKLLRIEHPEIETELIHGVSGTVLERVTREQLDAAFYLCSPDDLDSTIETNGNPIHIVKLADFSYKVIAPAGWQNRIENADWPELAALPWIGTPEASAHNRLLAPIFRSQGITQNIVALVDQEASMLEMVRSGVGLSLCREGIAINQMQTAGLAVCAQVSVPCYLSLVTLKHRQDSPAISALLGLLQTIW